MSAADEYIYTPESWGFSWPPAYFAVLQDGDGEMPYFRAIGAEEPKLEFAERIGKLAAMKMRHMGTLLITIVDGETGESDVVMEALARDSTTRYREWVRQAELELDLTESAARRPRTS